MQSFKKSVDVRLMRVVGQREQGPALLAAASEARMRAFTRFTHLYEETRRAVRHLRGSQGDADSIALTLYPGRPKRRQPSEPQPSPPDGTHTPIAATPVPAQLGGTTTSIGSVSLNGAAAPVAAHQNTSSNTDPFVS